jgi:hypothetical protein
MRHRQYTAFLSGHYRCAVTTQDSYYTAHTVPQFVVQTFAPPSHSPPCALWDTARALASIMASRSEIQARLPAWRTEPGVRLGLVNLRKLQPPGQSIRSALDKESIPPLAHRCRPFRCTDVSRLCPVVNKAALLAAPSLQCDHTKPP